MRTVDWVRFANWLKEIGCSCGIDFDSKGKSIDNKYSEGTYIIVTDELINASQGKLNFVKLIFIGNKAKKYAEASEDIYFNSLSEFVYFPGKENAEGLKKCKDIFKRDYDIDLDEYRIWIDDFYNSHLADGYVYNFKLDEFLYVNREACFDVIGFMK